MFIPFSVLREYIEVWYVVFKGGSFIMYQRGIENVYITLTKYFGHNPYVWIIVLYGQLGDMWNQYKYL